MQGFTLGAGLASLAFWGFIASVVVAGIWYDIRKKDAQQETVRRLFESGQKVDDATLNKILALGGDKGERMDRGLKVAALIVLPAGIGLAIFGYLLGFQNEDARMALYGVGALVFCVGLGLLLAAQIATRWYEEDEKSGNQL